MNWGIRTPSSAALRAVRSRRLVVTLFGCLLFGASSPALGVNTFSVADVVVSEGTHPTAVFTIRLDRDEPGAASVFYETQAGLTNPATAGDDYTAAGPTEASFPDVPFAAVQTLDVSIPIVDDAMFENDETFRLQLIAPVTNGVLAVPPNDGATATITDTADRPTIAIAATTPTVAEGGNVTYTVTRTGATEVPTTATIALTGTATAGSDYTTPADLTITIPPNSPTGTVNTDTLTVTTLTNAIFEGDETLTATLTPTTANAQPGAPTTATATITDTADTPNVTITNEIAAEGSPANFVVSMSHPSTQAVQVTYSTANATAVAPGDYTAATAATVTFPAGTNADQPIAVTTVQDTIDELNETFQVNLTAATGGATITGPQGIGTITDDDTASISLADVTVTEGNTQLAPATNANFSATLSTTSDRAITVDFATSDGTAVAGADFTDTTSSITFPANSAAPQTITIPVRGDLLDEDALGTTTPLPNETFTVTLTAPTNGATLTDAVAAGNITDDDATPTLSIAGTTVAEGTGGGPTPATFGVTLSAPSGLPVVASFATTDGTAVSAASATSPVDFTSVSAGSITIPAGATTPTVPATVQVAPDTTDELATEAFTVALSNPGNATIATGTATGTITDDDALPVITINDIAPTEGDTGTTSPLFTVSLSNPSFQPVQVTYATQNGTATAPADYTAPVPTVLTISPLLTSGTFPIQVNGDVLDEADLDTALVNLTLPVNGTIGDAQGILNIADDDALPTVAFNPVSTELQIEGNAGVTVKHLTLALNVPSGRDLTVTYETASIPAFAPNGTPNVDYVQVLPTTLTFLAGQTTKDVPITVIGDTNASEGSESIGIQLSNPANATTPSPQKHLLILEDDILNIPPNPVTDTLSVNRNAAGTVNVRANDLDANNDALFVPSNTQPAHGTAFCQSSSGVCLYTPTAGYSGPDSFSYEVSDGQANATGTVNVTVVNATPIAATDTLTTGQGTAAAVNVVANDSDPDGVTLTVSNGTNGAHGTATCSAGSCTYTPAVPGYIGPDTFTYTLTDADGATAIGTVNVTIGKGKALTFTAKATSGKSKVGARNGYTLTLKNPNGSRVKVTSISVCVPKGFKYVPGSSSGAFKQNPIKGGTCAGGATKFSWGKVTVPANGSIVQRFKVTVGGAPKTVKLTASGKALEQFVIAPLAPAAPIKVTAAK